jgi:Leucine-rich repeat (LRR) protein
MKKLLILILIVGCGKNSTEPFVCDEGLTELDGKCIFECDEGITECYYQGDLDVLQNIIDVNDSLTGESLELGEQKWENGRLLKFRFYDFISTEPLIFTNNQIHNLPESLGELSYLDTLIIRTPYITHIPLSIGNLRNLKFLSLSSFENNNISSLPTNFGNLNKLNILQLNGFNFSIYPEIINKLSNLIYLNLEGNQLTYIPASIGDLVNLLYLDLGWNKIETLPESICQIFPNIKTTYNDGRYTSYFDVSHNQICGEFPSCLTSDDVYAQNCD